MIPLHRVLRVGAAVVTVLACARGPLQGAQPSSYFDADAEGWSLLGDGTGFRWDSVQGNPAGSIFGSDLGQGVYWYFAAPAKFLGNQEANYGGTLSFDIRPSAVDAASDTSPDLILVGAGLTLHWIDALPKAATWDRQVVPLVAGPGWAKSTGGAVSESEMKSVLGGLTQLSIRGEFRTGLDEAFLDNVEMRSSCEVARRVRLFQRGPGSTSADASAALGYPDAISVALGTQGVLEVEFDTPLRDRPGFDVVVYEIGNARGYTDENYRVEASDDGVNFVSIGECSGGECAFDVGNTELGEVFVLRITDLLPETTGSGSSGVDIDAVQVVHCCGGEGGVRRYGRPLFRSLCTSDAATLPGLPGEPFPYAEVTIDYHRSPSDRLFLSSQGDAFVGLVVDDAIHVNGIASGLGPYGFQAGVPPFILGVPITDNLSAEPPHELGVDLIPIGSNRLVVAAIDTQREIYGNTPVYLLPDCGLLVDGTTTTSLRFLSHDDQQAGTEPHFDIRYGSLSELRADGGFSRSTCLGQFLQNPAVDDRPLPDPGECRYYLARGLAACSASGFGDGNGASPDPRRALDGLSPCP